MNIAIIGFDRQGRSAFDYWNKPENHITICDRDKTISTPNGAEVQLGEDYLSNLERFDLIVRTPGLHPKNIQEKYSSNILEKVTTVTNEFIRVCPSRHIIGVTGTKGKGTTSTLIAKMLETIGYRTHLGGNIGIAPLALLNDNIDKDDWVVLELANFQLIDLKYSPHIAICLMVEPEHLDWHTNVEEYYASKSQLFINQKNNDVAIYDAENEVSRRIASSGLAQTKPYLSPPGAYISNNAVMIDNKIICQTDKLGLIGQHNWQNVCAAVTCLWQIDQKIEAIKEVLTTFKGLPYRIQPIGNINGVRFFNDSFSSQPSASIAAINAISGKKVIILGGKDRGLDLTKLSQTISSEASNLRHIILIGESADRIADTLQSTNYTNYTISEKKDMLSIVKQALTKTKPGDALVLSPGFPSFDMFKDFEQRGEQFNEAVSLL